MSRSASTPKIGDNLGAPYCCGTAMSETSAQYFGCTSCGCSISTDNHHRITSIIGCSQHKIAR